jgi:hypothetical protein
MNCDAYVFFYIVGSWEFRKICPRHVFWRVGCLACDLQVTNEAYNSPNYVIFLNIFWIMTFYQISLL